jgi:hypothetical protein
MNTVQLSIDEAEMRPISDPTPIPTTISYLRAMVQARLRYFSTPLPDGYQLPPGIRLDDVLPPADEDLR